MKCRPHGRYRQRGVALALLLVMLAALSLLVLGVATEARTEARLAQVFVQRAQAAALAEGAIHLALRDLSGVRDVDPGAARSPLDRSYRLDGRDVFVELTPANGLLSVTAAPVELLADLLRIVGRMTRADAQRLAEEIEDTRLTAAMDAEKAQVSLSALEDLLLLPGMQRAVYERVAPLLTVTGGNASVDPALAPEELLPVLAASSGEGVATLRRARREAREGNAPVPLGGAMSAVVTVAFADGARLTRRMEVIGGAGGGGWKINRLYPVVAQRRSQ